MSRKVKLDELDYKIIEILQLNASISNRELAKKIGLSPPATLNRTKKLLEDDYIMTPRYHPNFKKLGFDYTSIVLTELPESHLEMFKTIIKETPGIVFSTRIKREVQRDLLSDFKNTMTHFISHCAFKTKGEMVDVWSDIVVKLDGKLSFQVYEALERVPSGVPVPINLDTV